MKHPTIVLVTLTLVPLRAFADDALAEKTAAAVASSGAVRLILEPGLKAHLPELDSEGPTVGAGWGIEENGAPIAAKELAHRLYADQRIQAYERRIGWTPFLVGASAIAVGIAGATTSMVVSADLPFDSGNQPGLKAATVGFSVTAGLGGLLALGGLVAHLTSDYEVPLSVGAELVIAYNEVNPLKPRAAAAPIVEAPTPRQPAAPAPGVARSARPTGACTSSSLGVLVVDSDGVRVFFSTVLPLERGDQILVVAGVPIVDEAALEAVAARLHAGEVAEIDVKRRGQLTRARVEARGCVDPTAQK